MNWICSHCGEKFSRFRTRCPSDGQRVIEDLAGQLIGGRYRIRELIGIGGMDSTVWKAWQTGTERVVAVKVLPAAEEAAAKRFSRGARIAANLNHPNCTVVHDYGRSDDGKLFLVMEFLAGQVLQDILAPEGMSVADAMHVADQVLQALEHAHAQRAVHRDLKPDNLFLCRKNDDPLHVKILDFGIAKYVEEDPEHTASAEETTNDKDGFEDLVTEQRQVCGTPQYMAPEQVVGARIDGRTDLYSLGCVMYRMLTGRLPFDGKTRYELYQKHLQEAPRPFADVRPDLVFPERLELIIMKVLNKRPDHRFQSASEMRKALETVELPEDRLRRANRPRVSLKHTSPQDRGPLPTVLPGPAWTLSMPAPPPVPGRPARNDEVGVTILPTDDSPLVEVDPKLDVSPSAAVPRFAAASQPGSVSRPGGKRTTGVANVVLSPSLVAQEEARAVRPPTGLLNDAVVRHPASRSPLIGSDVPRSTETEPNTLASEGDDKKRRFRVAAILAAAFLVGVGGVALIMKLTQKGGAADTAGVPTRVEPERIEAAKPELEQPNVAPAAVDLVDKQAPEVPAPTPHEAVAVEAVTAGFGAGDVLGQVALAPRAEVVWFHSVPSGATVQGPQGELTTPCALTLRPGTHQIQVRHEGYHPQTVDVSVATEPTATGHTKPYEVVLTALAQPPRPLPRTQISRPFETPGARVDPVPDRVEKPIEKPNERPQVRLLEDNPSGGTDKKPTVRLLEDDSPTEQPKKPQVKVLGD